MAQGNQQRMFVSAGVVVIAVGILMVGIFVPGNRKAATPGDEMQDARGGERSTGTAMSLHAAAALGDTESLRDALAADERIDAMYAGDDPAMSQMTPIMLAAQGGHAETVQAIIDHGAQLDTARAGGMTALMFAAQSGSGDTLMAMLNAGASRDIKTERGRGTLFFAAQGGDVRCVEILLESGEDANAADAGGVAPLMVAAEAARTDAVLALLDAGADAFATDALGKTALDRVDGRTDADSQSVFGILRDATRP